MVEVSNAEIGFFLGFAFIMGILIGGLITDLAMEEHYERRFGYAKSEFVPECRIGSPRFWEIIQPGFSPDPAVQRLHEMGWVNVSSRFRGYGAEDWVVRGECEMAESSKPSSTLGA